MNFGRTAITIAVCASASLGGLLTGRSMAQTTAPTVAPERGADVLEQRPLIPTTQTSRISRDAESQLKYEEGVYAYNNARLAQAEQRFRELLADNPADVDAYFYLGLAQLDQNRPGESVPNFSQAVRLDPSFDEARAARATALIRQARYDEAEQDINALAVNPRFRAQTAYLRGQLLYAKGDLDGAAAAFGEAKKSGELEATPAGFYEGLTYLRMRSLVKARQTFAEGAVDADRDPTLAAASRQLDAVLALQQQRPSKPWEVQLTVAYEYDSNVIQIGSGVSLPTGITGQADSRIVVQPRGSYSFIQNETLEVGIEANGYFAWQFDLSDFDVASYQAGPFVNYRVKDNLYASFRYGFNYIELGHEPYLTRNVFTPQVTYVEKDFGYTSAYYQFQTGQFDGPPPSEETDRDGDRHTLGIVQGINLPEIFRDAGPANLELSYRLDRQLTKGSDYDGWFNTIGGVLYTPLPFLKLRADIGTTFSYEYYDNPNSLDASGDNREDWEFNFSAGVTRQITREISFRMDYTYTDHLSNVETFADQKPFEYDRHQFGVRMIMSF